MPPPSFSMGPMGFTFRLDAAVNLLGFNRPRLSREPSLSTFAAISGTTQPQKPSQPTFTFQQRESQPQQSSSSPFVFQHQFVLPPNPITVTPTLPSSQSTSSNTLSEPPTPPRRRVLQREETEILYDNFSVHETKSVLASQGVNARDFIHTPSPPVVEYFDPLKSIAEYDIFLGLPSRQIPIHGKLLRRLIDIGWLDCDKENHRWLDVDRRSLQAYDDLCVRRWTESGSKDIIRPKGIRGNPGEYPYRVPRTIKPVDAQPLNSKYRSTWLELPSASERALTVEELRKHHFLMERTFKQQFAIGTVKVNDDIFYGPKQVKSATQTAGPSSIDADADATFAMSVDVPLTSSSPATSPVNSPSNSPAKKRAAEVDTALEKEEADSRPKSTTYSPGAPNPGEDFSPKRRKLLDAAEKAILAPTPVVYRKQFPAPVHAYAPEDRAAAREAKRQWGGAGAVASSSRMDVDQSGTDDDDSAASIGRAPTRRSKRAAALRLTRGNNPLARAGTIARLA